MTSLGPVTVCIFVNEESSYGEGNPTVSLTIDEEGSVVSYSNLVSGRLIVPDRSGTSRSFARSSGISMNIKCKSSSFATPL